MKKIIICLLLAMTAVFCTKSVVYADKDQINRKEVISEKLKEKMNMDFWGKNEYTLLVELNETLDVSADIIALENRYTSQLDNLDTDQIQNLLMKFREEKRELILSIQSTFLDNVNNKNIVIQTSGYTPFLIINTNKAGVISISKMDEVKGIQILDPNGPIELLTDDSFSFYQPPMSVNIIPVNYQQSTKIWDVINFDYPTIDGSGITIGILDNYIDLTHPQLSSNMANVLFSGTETNHATTQAIIAAGRMTGVAQQARVIAAQMQTDYYPLIQTFENLVDLGANVINCSWSYGTTLEYDDISMWIDSFIESSKVTIVFSAGNADDENDMLMLLPSLASNTIIVGSSNGEGTLLSYFSKYETNYYEPFKPTLVAPGGNVEDVSLGVTHYHPLYVPYHPYDYDYEVKGTSFAAPQVSGAIALMYDYNSRLLFYPQEVISLLVAGASNSTITNITYDSNDISDEAGSGLLNLSKTFEIMSKYNSVGYGNNSTSVNTVVKTIYFSLFLGEKVVISHAFIRNQSSSNNIFDCIEMSNYDIRVKNPSGSIIASSYGTISNIDKVVFIAQTSGTYKVEVILVSKSSSGRMDFGSVSFWSETGRTIIVIPSSC